jgi:hypothetical protein
MFPILVWVYARLARNEEREVAKEFGADWTAYAQHTPAFWPRLKRPPAPPQDASGARRSHPPVERR